MNKNTQIHGVDISKDIFDVANSEGIHLQFPNDSHGFKSFLKSLSDEDLVVMEATGYYHYKLTQFLFEQGIKVSVVNPLSVKRFIQMKLSKVKTDKSDARSICEYATVNEVPLYTAPDEYQAESLQLPRFIEIYTEQNHGEKVLGKPSKAVFHSLNPSQKVVQKEIKILEDRLTEIVKEEQQKQLTLLKSIPGMGNKTAILLLVLTEGFSIFENARQRCCYAGITSIIRESGTSVKGRSRISKMGNAKLRNLLFMCSFTGCNNKACREIYERIIAKGTCKKLA